MTPDRIRQIFKGLETGDGAAFFAHVADDATLQEAGTHLLDGVAADVEGRPSGHVAAPVAQLEQHLGAGAGAGTDMPAMHDRLQADAVGV
jgi:ketosteroid isomerase-like protein